MAKKTPEKKVILSQDELREICQRAVEDGVSKYISLEDQKKKREWRGLLFRTKKLLENYTALITAILRAKPATAKGQYIRL